MNLKRRGLRISLYRSIWVPRGPGVPHGYTRQNFIGSIAADTTEVSEELERELSPTEIRELDHKVIQPARIAKEAALRQAKLRETDPVWRLEEALRLVNEAAECSLSSAVPEARKSTLKSALEKVMSVGATAPVAAPSEPLREALKAINAASHAVRQGRYGRGPKSGFRSTPVFRQWTEILAAVDGSEQSLLRALQDAGFATRRAR
ncbi:hypothetical protein [Hydrogenophaga sp.]|uniref:hypothetical protein n=1 Tax=Hydrogenophaga sp. TaxID=1904254 RepID=UPI0027270E93|nr:hypothetical protein [Hydrogenophaga sp.]MDO8905954.1 hypothetical protein [Hydrogenophaga sp.]